MAVFIVNIDDDALRNAKGVDGIDPPSYYRDPKAWLEMLLAMGLNYSPRHPYNLNTIETMTIVPMKEK